MWLSFDWSMGAVPLIESVFDSRNLFSILLYTSVAVFVVNLFQHLNARSAPRKSCDKYNTSFSPVWSNSGNSRNGIKEVTSSNGYHSLPAGVLSSRNLEKSETSYGANKLYNQSNNFAQKVRWKQDSLKPPRITLAWNSFNFLKENGKAARGGDCEEEQQQHVKISQNYRNGGTKLLHPIDALLSTDRISPRSYKRLHLQLIALSILVFPFLPATNLFFYVGFVLAERVLYMSSMGYCLLVALGVDVLLSKTQEVFGSKFVVQTAVVMLVVVYGLRTIQRNRDWLTEESLYRSGVAVNPAKGLFILILMIIF